MGTGLSLAEAALDELKPEAELWASEEAPPAEVEPLLGRWWSEGREFVFSWRRGKLEARYAAAPPERRPTVFEPDGEDRFRAVSGDERGELLRVVRGDDGSVTYPFTRTPDSFGAG
jgi:hypothetical protein